MLKNANFFATNATNSFYCEMCDYTSKRKNDFAKHLSTTKHKNANKMLTKATKVAVTGAPIIKQAKPYNCDVCGKGYIHKSSFCRHKKKCCMNVKLKKIQ